MKILILSDLHISANTVSSQFKLDKLKRTFQNQINEEYDMVIISGDVFEHNVIKYINVFDTLKFIFDNKNVVFCLGNHEFAFEHYDSVIVNYKKMYEDFIKNEENKNSNICCLDINNYFDFEDSRVVGNVFWYDWSLNNNRTLMKGEIVDGWLDSTIENFDPLKEHDKCKKQIFDNIDEKKNMILVTHMVPHIDLNTFNHEDPYSIYNSYSGEKDFLKEIQSKNFKLAFCGHTHRKEIREIRNIKCFNIGNDYFFRTNKIDWIILQVDKNLNIEKVQTRDYSCNMPMNNN